MKYDNNNNNNNNNNIYLLQLGCHPVAVIFEDFAKIHQAKFKFH